MYGNRIIIKNVELISVKECTLNKEVGEHGSANIIGIIEEENITKAEQLLKSTEILQVIVCGENQSRQAVFSGLVESGRIYEEGQLYTISLHLCGATKLLDIKRKTRTFQNSGLSYESLFDTVDGEYGIASHRAGIELGKSIGDMIVQYQETDWEFINRLASHFHVCVYNDFSKTKLRYYIGLYAQGSVKDIQVSKYSVEYGNQRLYQKQENGLSELVIGDETVYSVESKESYEIGQVLQFKGKQLYVENVQAKLVQEEILFTYGLKTKKGFKRIKQYNKNLVGASLSGRILDVKADKVKVHITIDESQSVSTAKWFPYSTVYSSPDGSGWYCMPEKNDRVRVYFPNEKEEDAYAISSIHEQNSVSGGQAAQTSQSNAASQPPRSNPDNKSISTKYGKQVELTPTSITMTNNNGMIVTLDDETGIAIISDKDITISSEGKVTLASASDSMALEAKEGIELIQGNAKMTLKDEITVEGAQFKMQ